MFIQLNFLLIECSSACTGYVDVLGSLFSVTDTDNVFTRIEARRIHDIVCTDIDTDTICTRIGSRRIHAESEQRGQRTCIEIAATGDDSDERAKHP